MAESGTVRGEIGAAERKMYTRPIQSTGKETSAPPTPCACCVERGIHTPRLAPVPDRRLLSFGTAITAAVAFILTVTLMSLPNFDFDLTSTIRPVSDLISLNPLWGSATRISETTWTTEVTPDEPEVELEATWEHLKGAQHCLRYATRQYTARLVNIPSGVPGVKACRETSALIHGVDILPHFCEDLGMAGGVWGYWIIDFEEPACLTSWGSFVDKGCDDQGTASMTRRFEALLEHMQHGDNWQIMCATTPADLKGFHFPTPTMCERWVRPHFPLCSLLAFPLSAVSAFLCACGSSVHATAFICFCRSTTLHLPTFWFEDTQD
ncbi:hypothetical protein NMY22_g5513 [Coprinellus aureogranulatus]|nr:hypothetical protein NMY22_g5513 [Coprinellus aureogranulatus]